MSLKPRISSVLAVVAAITSGAALFWTSQQVQTAEAHRQRLEDAVAGEKQTLRVLRAEWDYLSRPDRIEALARAYLNMTPPVPGNIVPSAAALPGTSAPVMPGRKPAFTAQPVALTEPVSAPSPAVPAKPVPPVAPADKTPSFQKLLDTLGEETP